MHVLIMGESDDGISVSSHHARAIETLSGVQVSFADAHSTADAVEGGPRIDVVHLITFQQTSNALLRRLVSSRMSGVPIVRYWTGRDLVWARHHQPSQEFAQTLYRMGASQLCRSPELAGQLSEMEIEAKPLPIISAHISSAAQPQGMPSTFTALCYLPAGRREFHGGGLIDALAARLPRIRFLVLGGGAGPLSEHANVEVLPADTDAVRAILRSTVILDARVDRGLSRLVLEALCHGRHVITSCDVPHCHRAGTLDEFVEALRALREQAPFHLEGRSFVGVAHERHAAIRALRRELEDAIEPGRLNLFLEGGLRGAAATVHNLHLLAHRDYPLPEFDQLPEEAHALRCLLHDLPQHDVVVAS